VEELELFPRLTRALFKQMYGFQAPPYDPKEPVRRFFDSGAAGQPDEPYTYGSWTAVNGKPYYRRVVITVAQARVPNLPGTYEYARYAAAPTGAHWTSNLDGQETALNPEYLSTAQEAAGLAAELSGVAGLSVGDVSEQQLSNPAALLVYPADEQRRVYVLQVNGEFHNVGLLRKAKFVQGVDAPGRWVVSANSPAWLPEIPQDTGELSTEMPAPQRELYANERMEIGFGGNLAVRRTDTPGTQAIDDEKSQAARVREILERVIRIEQQLGSRI
jgi:hypothetical protein